MAQSSWSGIWQNLTDIRLSTVADNTGRKPAWQRIEDFDEGVLFFVILATGLILMLGAMIYRDHRAVWGQPFSQSPENIRTQWWMQC